MGVPNAIGHWLTFVGGIFFPNVRSLGIRRSEINKMKKSYLQDWPEAMPREPEDCPKICGRKRATSEEETIEQRHLNQVSPRWRW